MIEKVAQAAAEAASQLATWSGTQRRGLLDRLADALAASGEEAVATAVAETGLTQQRLVAELDRTVGQLRLLGEYVDAGRDRPVVSSPGAAADGSDIVTIWLPIGPVAVFAASNFPFAFGVLGTDTAAALAAGCPVIVKGHPAQPTLTALLMRIANSALVDAPAGTLSLAPGGVPEGLALVGAPQVKAVAFTGSMAGGRALMDAAAARPDPIPVYAEMGSLNPVFVMPSALSDESWAATLATSVTGSAGQLCTKPGLVVIPDTVDGQAFATKVADLVAGAGPVERMLTPGMAAAHLDWLGRASSTETVAVAPGDEETIRPFAVTTRTLDHHVLEEHFGPTTVLCLAPIEQYVALVDRIPGSLAGAILAGDSAAEQAVIPSLVGRLAQRVGRIIFNGVPTGVAVTDAMHHGGPWPAASNARYTSVGTHAVDRFVRPVALQGAPSAIAPYIT